jgi:hypothetical protein
MCEYTTVVTAEDNVDGTEGVEEGKQNVDQFADTRYLYCPGPFLLTFPSFKHYPNLVLPSLLPIQQSQHPLQPSMISSTSITLVHSNVIFVVTTKKTFEQPYQHTFPHFPLMLSSTHSFHQSPASH